MAWLTGWKYRKSITLSRASGAVTNYQMKLLLGESSGATGESVDCGGLCLSTFNDIRFTKSDGYTLLDYWIESLSGTTPNQLATIWIEFDSIGTSDTTFYMYYGKSNATSVSNGNNTFNFFDDFADASLDTNKWTNLFSGGVSEGSGSVVVTADSADFHGIRGITAFGSQYALRARIKPSHVNTTSYLEQCGFAGIGDTYHTSSFFCHIWSVLNHKHVCYTYPNNSPSEISGDSAGTYFIYEVKRNSSTNATFLINAANSVVVSTYVSSADMYPTIAAHTSGSQIEADWLVVRQYLATEPSWGTWSEAAEWLSGWNYRKSITLSRASGAVNNYQMKLLVGETSGATGENVDCAGLCLSNFNDIRFTNSNGTTLLDYWIESITGVSPNQLATIWIEFDTIGVDATTFYMYYGNSSAISLSNGSNTFIKFEDFEWGSQGSNLNFSGGSNTWTSTQGVATIDASNYYGAGTKSAMFTGASTFPVYSIPCQVNENSSIQVRVYKETAVVNGPNLSQGNGTKRWAISCNSSETIYVYNGSTNPSVGTLIPDTWQILEFNSFNYTAGTYDIWLNGTRIATAATMETSSLNSGVLALLNADTSSSNDVWYDNIIVRNWVATEPSWGTWSTTLENVDSYTKLLIHGNRNIGIVDSATGKTITVNGGAAISSGKTITTYGNAAIVSGRPVTVYGNAQLSIVQSKFGGSSGLFDGTDDRISLPASSDFDFGTGDFTIDFWVYFTSTTGSQYLFDIGMNNSLLNYNTGVWTIKNPTTTTILSYTYTPSINIWIHVAIGRNGTNWYFFIGGVLKTISTSSLTYGASNLVFTIGNYGIGGAYGLKGYIDEFRVSKGILRWTTDFNVSTAPYEADSYTKLLLHFNDTTIFYDHSLCRPYFGDVGYFDGTNSYLTLADSDDWNFGAGDFTVECWYRPNVLTTSSQWWGLVCQRGSWTSNHSWSLQVNENNNGFNFCWSLNGTTSVGSAHFGGTLSLYTWYHVAASRIGDKLYLAVNGVVTQQIATASAYYNSTSPIAIGRLDLTQSGDVKGWIDEVRISKGIARWTSNFTPSTVPYESDSYTKLLINFNKVSGATTFYDYSICRANSGEVLYLDGSGDYLTIPDSNDWYFGTEPFTIDLWYYPITNPGTGVDCALITQRYMYNNNNSWTLGAYENKIYFGWTSTGTDNPSVIWTPTIVAGQWYHIAVSRIGANLYCAINGVVEVLTGTTASFFNGTDIIKIGVSDNLYNKFITGYIDELRVSKGIARWTSNFTPPIPPYFITTTLPTPTSKRPLCIYSGGIRELSIGDSIAIAGEYQLTYSSAISVDFTSYDIQSVMLTGNTVFTLNNIVNGKHCSLVVTQDSAGNRIATFTNTIKWYQGITPTLSIASSITDIFTFVKSRDILYGYCSKAFQEGS